MPGRVFVTGASGFVGAAVVEELASRQYAINALANRQPITAGGGAVKSVKGSLFDASALDEGMRGCDAVIHLVGIIMEDPAKGVTFERIHFEGTKNVVDAVKRAGIKRYIHMSALGTRPDAVSNYHKTKYRAEEYVCASGLEWTIFRPSLIHGPQGEFMRMEAKWAKMQSPPFLFMPYFGAGVFGCGGAGMLQPVYVCDVARAFVDALEKRATVGEIFPLAGADEVTWPQMHKTVSTYVVGHPRWTMAIPAWKAKVIAKLGLGSPPVFVKNRLALWGWTNPLPEFNLDQVQMSQEDNTADVTKFVDEFGWMPKGFDESLKTYAGQL